MNQPPYLPDVRLYRWRCTCGHRKSQHKKPDGSCLATDRGSPIFNKCECAGFYSEVEDRADWDKRQAQMTERVSRIDRITRDWLEGSVNEEDMKWLITEYSMLVLMPGYQFFTKADKEKLLDIGKKLANASHADRLTSGSGLDS